MKKTLVLALAAAALLASCESPIKLGTPAVSDSGAAAAADADRAAKPGDQVSVAYTGTKTDGSVFDATSRHDGVPLEFVVGAGQMIKGFDEGVVGMKVGETKTIVIPAEKAYGPKFQASTLPRDLFNATIEQTFPERMFQTTLTETVPASMLPPESSAVGSTWTLPDGTKATVLALSGSQATVSYPNAGNPFAGKKIAKGTKGVLPNGAKIEIVAVKEGQVTIRAENKDNPFAGKKLKVGMEGRLDEGAGMALARISALTATGVTLEVANAHPLAGETLQFEVKMLSIK